MATESAAPPDLRPGQAALYVPTWGYSRHAVTVLRVEPCAVHDFAIVVYFRYADGSVGCAPGRCLTPDAAGDRA